MARVLLKVLAASLLIFGIAAGGMRAIAENGDASHALVPHPPKGKGEHCVAPTPFMRRNHMSMLLHHRTVVVHEGIRTEQYDLNRCISCHVVNGADGKPVSYSNPKHFCRSCHDYAAVSIDCFECHASRPGEPNKSATIIGSGKFATADPHHGDPHGKEIADLTKYLGGTKR